jgi:nitrogenase molybdenum-iron protein alpha/beta subunit
MDFSRRLNHPYLVGVYLAINAVRDACLLVDGPGCAFTKACRIYGKHDWNSTLLSCVGDHRVQFTGTTVQSIVLGAEKEFRANLLEMLSRESDAGVFLAATFPFCSIVGTQYDLILREAALQESRPLMYIAGRSFESDWLDGYAEVLATIASSMAVPPQRGPTEDVAVVGYLMDRLEWEHQGNVRELRRILKALGLNPVSFWLSGETYEDMLKAGSAGTILSLPYGRQAAAEIARRTGASLIETDLPLGLEGTQRWIRQVAGGTGREDRGEAFIERELGDVVPKLEWVVPSALLNRKFAFAGDAHLFAGFSEMVEGLGGRVIAAFLTNRSNGEETPPGSSPFYRRVVKYEPREAVLMACWKDIEKETDLLVANTFALEILRPTVPSIEFGFPSYFTHFIKEEPFMGFRGSLGFIQQMVNALNSRYVIARPGMRS